MINYEEFESAYIEAAMTLCSDDNDDDIIANHSVEDISPGLRAEVESDCRAFIALAEEIFAKYPEAARAAEEAFSAGRWTLSEHAGNDFWMTRNGHGAGFWDGDWNGGWAGGLDITIRDGETGDIVDQIFRREYVCPELGEELTCASHKFGESEWYVYEEIIYGS